MAKQNAYLVDFQERHISTTLCAAACVNRCSLQLTFFHVNNLVPPIRKTYRNDQLELPRTTKSSSHVKPPSKTDMGSVG